MAKLHNIDKIYLELSLKKYLNDLIMSFNYEISVFTILQLVIYV